MRELLEVVGAFMAATIVFVIFLMSMQSAVITMENREILERIETRLPAMPTRHLKMDKVHPAIQGRAV